MDTIGEYLHGGEVVLEALFILLLRVTSLASKAVCGSAHYLYCCFHVHISLIQSILNSNGQFCDFKNKEVLLEHSSIF